MGFFWVIWCTYNNPTPLIQQSMGQNHHYPWVRVLEQHAALYTILYTILIGCMAASKLFINGDKTHFVIMGMIRCWFGI